MAKKKSKEKKVKEGNSRLSDNSIIFVVKKPAASK